MMRRRRPLSRLIGRMGGQPAVPPMLLDANRLFEQGDYHGAAERFETLALRQDGRQRPRITANLLYQAGRARLLAGQPVEAARLMRGGLSVLGEHRRWRALRQMITTVDQELRAHGAAAQAAEIQAWLNGQPLPTPAEASEQADSVPEAQRRIVLPTRCPSCGAPVDPRTVEWADEQTAECIYCGGMIRAEEG